jgi:hypothetical protein
MHWTGWVVVVLIIINAGWMAFDGARALITGDYVTPQKGQYAGQLGPWASLVQAAGIPPRSSLMKLIFVGYGVAAIIMAVGFAFQLPGARWGLVVTAVLGLWYLPFGTVINLIALVLLFLPPLSQ